jgi:hypothetical protein
VSQATYYNWKEVSVRVVQNYLAGRVFETPALCVLNKLSWFLLENILLDSREESACTGRTPYTDRTDLTPPNKILCGLYTIKDKAIL